MVPIKELRIVLYYLGHMWNIPKTKLTKAVNENLKVCQLNALFEATKNSRTIFV